MHLKLKDQQVKTVLFIYRPLYQNFMEITNQKSTIDEKKKKHHTQRKAIQNNTKVSYQITRDKNKRGKKTYKFKTINKMAIRTSVQFSRSVVSDSLRPHE